MIFIWHSSRQTIAVSQPSSRLPLFRPAIAMQTRRVARELALLGISQLSSKLEKDRDRDLTDILASAVKTLQAEAREALEGAGGSLQRGNDRLNKTELLDESIQAGDAKQAIALVREAIGQTQEAIERVAMAIDFPVLLQSAEQPELRAFAIELIESVMKYRDDVDEYLDSVMKDWHMTRLARIDADILRLATVELRYIGTPDRVAINEAVELAKRYSDEDSYRFVNGVLRRVVDAQKAARKNR
ncbi:MAG: transcription antitermination factor NusB [Cyanobacteria bacterium P01_D01_bin.73]